MRNLSKKITTSIQLKWVKKASIKEPLHCYFILHFNQNFVPYLDFVAMGFYQQIISILRKNSTFPLHLHLSGSLLTGLKWFNPKLVELLRQGVTNQQFELLYSTYSQAIPASISEEEFLLQTELHQQILKETFSCENLTTFWNPERIWTPQMTKWLCESGAQTTLLEDHLFEQITPDFKPFSVFHDNQELLFLPDSNEFRILFNDYLHHGNLDCLELYLRRTALDFPGSTLVYAEDAEAIGLWTFEDSPTFSTEKLFDNFSKFLQWFPRLDFIKLPKISQANQNKNVQNIAIPKGQSRWLKHAFSSKEARYHEEGFTDWFDYNKNSQSLQRVRKLQQETISTIEKTVTKLSPKNSESWLPLLNLAKFLYAHHQYEFGCPGIITDNNPAQTRVVFATIPLRIASINRTSTTGVIQEDLLRTGEEEIIVTSRNMAVIFSQSGEISGLYDLTHGTENIGGSLAVFLTENALHPAAYNVNLSHEQQLWPWLKNHQLGAFLTRSYPMRRVCLTEELTMQNEQIPLNFSFSKQSSPLWTLQFLAKTTSLKIEKQIDTSNNSLIIRYQFHNDSQDFTHFSFSVDTCFAPDYLRVIHDGISCLTRTPLTKIDKNHSNYKITNVISNKNIIIEFREILPTFTEEYVALHNLGTTFYYSLHISPDTIATCEIRLRLT